MIKVLNEASDLRIYDHIKKGDLVAFITAFRGIKNTIQANPTYLKHLFGADYPVGGERFDEETNQLILPGKYDQPGYYAQVKQTIRMLNRERNDKLRNFWLKTFQYSFIVVEGHYVEGNELITEESFVIFASPDREQQLIKLLADACEHFGQDSAIIVIDGEAKIVRATGLTREVVGAFRIRPTSVGDYYSRVKGKNFVFDGVKEQVEYAQHPHFDQMSEVLNYRTSLQLFYKALNEDVNYFALVEDSFKRGKEYLLEYRKQRMLKNRKSAL